MPNFSTQLSLSASSYPTQFHCSYKHNGALHMIDFNSVPPVSAPSGSFAPDSGGSIDLPLDKFNKLASNVNAGSPEITIETNPSPVVTNFLPGNQPSIPLFAIFVFRDIISCVYQYTDPATWQPTYRAIDFVNSQDPNLPPLGTFVVGQNSSIFLPPASMTQLATNLSPPPGFHTIAAIQTDPEGSVTGFNSSTAPNIAGSMGVSAVMISRTELRNACGTKRATSLRILQRAVILPEHNKPINDFCIRGLVDRRADLNRFVEITIVNTGNRRARTRGKFAQENDKAYCRLSQKSFTSLREALSRTRKNLELSIVVNSSGAIVDFSH